MGMGGEKQRIISTLPAGANSSGVRAPALHAGSRGFETLFAHHRFHKAVDC
jgi:hypothetical protein